MDFTQALFLRILNMSITASYVILAVLLLRIIIRKVPKAFSYGLWAVVGFRLICPISFHSIISVFNLRLFHFNTKVSSVGTMNYIPKNIGYMKAPEISTGIIQADTFMNSRLPAAHLAASINPMQVYIFLFTLLWIIGIITFIVYSIASYNRLHRMVSKAVLLRENIYECDKIPTPFVLGIIKPRIYIPFHLNDKELNYILHHENYHIKRRDYIIKPIAYLILTLYWFHPLVWIAYFCMNEDMEMSCDEKVLKDIGLAVKYDYSKSLLSFAVNRRFIATGPLSFGETNAKERINNILRFKKPKIWVSVIVGLVCLLVVFACAANPFSKANATEGRVKNNTEEGADSKEVTELARQLYAVKNPYIGNVSANGKILRSLDINKLGSATIELETLKKPYILRINFDNEVTNRDAFDLKMLRNASILLALIDNADEIQWSYPYRLEGKITRITVYWSEQNLKSMEIDHIKEYGISEEKVQELLYLLDNYDNEIEFSYADNVTNNTDGKPQDGNILTMEDLLAVKDWSNLTLDYFKAFQNAVPEINKEEYVLNNNITFLLSYGKENYELQISYDKENSSIYSILLIKKSDSDAILLYSSDPKYKTNSDIGAFLKKKSR